MIELALSTLIAATDPYAVPENVARYCAAYVGIPYASDNFTEKEWYQFQDCVSRRLKRLPQ
jgi:hypothetical protein